MENPTLSNVFNECLDRLAAGETVEQCLRRYPAHAEALRPLLQTVRLVQSSLPEGDEVRAARQRARARFETALAEKEARQSSVSWRAPRWLALAAMLAVVIAGVAFAASGSLPGDPLYGLKRGVEAIGLTLADDREAALERLRQTRQEETRLLLALGREATVSFSGVLETIHGDIWRVDDLALVVTAGTHIDAAVHPGDLIEVTARTTVDRRLIAEEIRLLEPRLPAEETVLPPTPTSTAPLTPETPATGEPDASLPSTLTETASSTATATGRPTMTSTPTLAVTPAATDEPGLSAREGCVPVLPEGWEVYQIRPGDTLYELAQATGTTVETVVSTNCLPASDMIRVDQLIYLPSIPSTAIPAPPDSGSRPSPQDDGSGSRDDSSGS